MAFDFKVGKFVNAVGLEHALDRAGPQLLKAADVHAAKLKAAFVFGGHANRGGEQWQPWSRAYALDAARRGQRYILLRTGAMRAGIGARVIAMTGPHYVVKIDTAPFYAPTHQRGSGNIPARPFLVVTDQDSQAFAKRISEWEDEALNGPTSEQTALRRARRAIARDAKFFKLYGDEG